ncbi:MAG: transcriptional regulator [Firmicutes bacterium]|nr:transcriptional regulator [Bacillota bacterium]
MNEPKSLNDKAWESLFEKYDILNRIDMDGCFQISAAQIKEFREPRLMAKFDHTINLPKIFAENKLSILPVTRGDYVISHFDAYHKFETADTAITKVSIPSHIQSLDYNNITSEAFALNCAAAAGIIEDFTDDEQIIPTVSGRMSSDYFHFNIMDTLSKKHREVVVYHSQIEIDAAYEGIRYLSLFEAKRDLSEDFLIRQLYYPYRTWRNSVEKDVKTIFLVYSNGIYRLYQYKFENPMDYSSLVLVKQRNYTIEDTAITSEDIQKILQSTAFIPEPSIPFPQADSFERVINLCELLNESSMNRDEVTEKYDFNVRQTNYYTDAARYLGLVEKSKENGIPCYHLTENGEKSLRKGYKQRQLDFCRRILRHKVFADVLKRYFESGVMPSNGEITRIMKQSDLYKVKSDDTFKRRASTIRGWIEWIVGLINE